jgi:thioredoxin-related protein
MIKKILLIIVFFNYILYANFQEGESLFKDKCSSCHKSYIPIKKLKENFFEKNNKLLNLTIPTVNLLSYAIMSSAKRIGDKDDPEMQQIEIEEYLKNYLENPTINNSICDETILPYYQHKKPIIISDEEAEKLALFFMNYKSNRLKNSNEKVKVLTKNHNELALLNEAKKLNKHLIVFATSKTCYFCKKMKREVLSLEDVKKKMNEDYIFVEVDIDNTNLPFGLKKHFRGMTPTFFVVTKEEKLLNTYPGAWVKKDFLEILKENLE